MFIEGRKHRLEAELHYPSKGKGPFPVAILVHGWLGDSVKTERNRRAKEIAELLLPAGWAALFLNLPGHGQSSGKAVDFTIGKGKEAVGEAIHWLKKQREIDSKRIALIGASLGGSVCILAAAHYRRTSALVVMSPRTDFKGTQKTLYDFIKRGEEEAGTQRNWKVRQAGMQTDFYAHGKRITSPTLVIHGEKDPYISPSQSLKLYSSLRLPREKKKLELLPEARHVYDGEDFINTNRMAAEWVIKHG